MTGKVLKSVEKRFFIRYDNYREAVLVAIGLLLLIGCAGLVITLDDDWTINIESRQYVLVIAGMLFVGSVALCWFVVKTERKHNRAELQLLLIDRPPSYESVILMEPPPPAYVTVVNCYLPQEATG